MIFSVSCDRILPLRFGWFFEAFSWMVAGIFSLWKGNRFEVVFYWKKELSQLSWRECFGFFFLFVFCFLGFVVCGCGVFFFFFFLFFFICFFFFFFFLVCVVFFFFFTFLWRSGRLIEVVFLGDFWSRCFFPFPLCFLLEAEVCSGSWWSSAREVLFFYYFLSFSLKPTSRRFRGTWRFFSFLTPTQGRRPSFEPSS